MEVYIETVVLNNLLINCVILLLTLKCLKIESRKWKIFVSALFGTLFAVCFPLFSSSIPSVVGWVIKCFAGGIMCFVIIQKPLKKIVSFYLVFLSNTFLLGGICYGISYALSSSFKRDFQFSTGFVLVVAVLFFCLVKRLCVLFYSRKQVSNFQYSVNLTINGITRNIQAYLDSGNLLKKNCVPVSILSLGEFEKFKTDVNIVTFLQRKTSKMLAECEFITYKTLSSENVVMVLKPEKFEIEFSKNLKFASETYIGVVPKEFMKTNGIGLLLNGALI